MIATVIVCAERNQGKEPLPAICQLSASAGIAIGHKLAQSFLQRPHVPAAAGAAMKASVVLADRLVVRKASQAAAAADR